MDKTELEKYRRHQKDLPERIRRYFDEVKRRVEEHKIVLSYPLGFLIANGCAREKNSYCDMCPVGEFFYDCPLGHSKEYSK
jgi:hypothetical protein